MKNLETLPCIVGLRAGAQSSHKTASRLFVVHNARDAHCTQIKTITEVCIVQLKHLSSLNLV